MNDRVHRRVNSYNRPLGMMKYCEMENLDSQSLTWESLNENDRSENANMKEKLEPMNKNYRILRSDCSLRMLNMLVH